EPLAILRDRADGEDRIAEDLELVRDAMMKSGIEMIRTADHQDGDVIVGLDLIEDCLSLSLEVGVEALHRGERLIHGEIALILGDLEDLPEAFVELSLEAGWLGEAHGRADVADAARCEKIRLFGEGGLDDL